MRPCGTTGLHERLVQEANRLSRIETGHQLVVGAARAPLQPARAGVRQCPRDKDRHLALTAHQERDVLPPPRSLMLPCERGVPELTTLPAHS